MRDGFILSSRERFNYRCVYCYYDFECSPPISSRPCFTSARLLHSTPTPAPTPILSLPLSPPPTALFSSESSKCSATSLTWSRFLTKRYYSSSLYPTPPPSIYPSLSPTTATPSLSLSLSLSCPTKNLNLFNMQRCKELERCGPEQNRKTEPETKF